MKALDYVGKLIVDIKLEDIDGPSGNNLSVITIKFDDGTAIEIRDAGQDCCEKRYTRTDDDLRDLFGDRLGRITVKEAPCTMEDDGEGNHEVCFLEISTIEGNCVVFSTHNENHGYYTGFELVISEPVERTKPTQKPLETMSHCNKKPITHCGSCA